MNIGELFVKLGFVADTQKLNDFNKNIKSVSMEAIKAGVAITAVAYAISRTLQASIETAVGLDNFAIKTGISVQSLQKWRYIAEQSNVSSQELEQSILGIQKAQAEIRLGGGNIKPFQMLGISSQTDPIKVIEQLQNRIKGLSPAIASSLLSQLGVGQNMIVMLKKSNFEFDQLNEKFLLTQKETDDLLELNSVFKDFIFTLKGIRDKLVALSSSNAIEFIKDLKEIFTNFFEITKAIYSVIDRFKWLGKAIAIVGIMAISIFSPWTALIAAIILIIEDLWVAFNGGDSVIGSILLPIWDWLKKIGEIIAVVLAKILGFKNSAEFIDSLKKSFISLWEILKKIGTISFDLLIEPIKKMIELLSPILKTLGTLIGGKIEAMVSEDRRSIADEKESKRIPPNNNSGGKSETSNNININVSGVSEAESKAVAFNIKRELDKVYYTKSVSV